MTDKTEMPERIWATGWGLPAQEESGTFVAVGNRYPTAPNADASAYIRKDLSDAKDKRIAELEQLVATLEAERDGLAERIGRSLDFINADMTDEAKQELRTTLAAVAELHKLKGTDT